MPFTDDGLYWEDSHGPGNDGREVVVAGFVPNRSLVPIPQTGTVTRLPQRQVATESSGFMDFLTGSTWGLPNWLLVGGGLFLAFRNKR